MHLEKIASVPRQACIGLSGQSVHVGVQRLTLLLPPRYEDMRIHLLGDGATSMAYSPKPIDRSQILLDAALASLTEQLAENVHDTWSQRRLAEGWRYGPSRNDSSKEHPNLVAYDQLPEHEREYDRKTALETIRMLLLWASGLKPQARRPTQRRSCPRESSKSCSDSAACYRKGHGCRNCCRFGTGETWPYGRIPRHCSVVWGKAS